MIDDSKEYIIASAIHYDNGIEYRFQGTYGIKTGFVLCGFRHGNVIGVLPTNIHYIINNPEEERQKEIGLKWNGDISNPIVTTGFLTSQGRYVDRRAAYRLAVECGQIQSDTMEGILYSEDVFPSQKYTEGK